MAADSRSEDRIALLETRLRRIEDELVIHRRIVAYGFAVDTGDAEATAELFAEDGVYDVDGTLIMNGREGVRSMVRGERHRSLLPNCAHTIGPALVEIDGDRAVATAYSRIYLRRKNGIALLRLSFNRFELERRGETWEITRRITRLMGTEAAQALLRHHLHEPFDDPIDERQEDSDGPR
jgi:ketosteroid isomerase-like protein